MESGRTFEGYAKIHPAMDIASCSEDIEMQGFESERNTDRKLL